MEIIPTIIKAIRKDIRSHRTPYGMVKTLVSSKNLTIELVEFTGSGDLSEHKHEKSRKIYYITRGLGKLVINGKIRSIDTMYHQEHTIEKNTPHYWKSWEDLEFLVIISPSIHPDDVIMVEK